MRPRALLVVMALGALVAPAARSGARDDKEKEKDKAAKAKPAARSYSDEDLKKYKETPKDGSAETQSETPASATVPVYGREAPARRARADGAQQPAVETPAGEEPASAEEADWKARAKDARVPVEAAESRIKGIEAQIAELRDKLNPMSTTYVLGGNSTAGPGAVLEVEEQLRVLDGQLGEARTAAAEAEKSWQKFLDEARAAGASPAWLKP